MTITKDTVKYVAALSRIRLSADEEEKAFGDMCKILEYMDKLSEINTENIDDMIHALPISNVFREDIPHSAMTQEQVLANAPKKKDGCFQVPKAVD